MTKSPKKLDPASSKTIPRAFEDEMAQISMRIPVYVLEGLQEVGDAASPPRKRSEVIRYALHLYLEAALEGNRNG